MIKPLFIHPVPGKPLAPNNTDATNVQINPDVLGAALLPSDNSSCTPPTVLAFNISPQQTFYLRTESIEPFLCSGLLWRGAVSSQPAIYAHLSVQGMQGNGPLHLEGVLYVDGKRYRLRTDDDASIWIEAIDLSSVVWRDPPLRQIRTDAAQPYESGSDRLSSIDVLALYPSALKKITSVDKLRAIVGVMQATANQVFQNSTINARVNFLAVEEFTAFMKTDVMGILREVANSDNQPVRKGTAWKAVSTRRAALGADVVLLLAEGTREGLGMVIGEAIAIPEPLRFDQSELSVATFAVAVDEGDVGLTFAHELGHLLGGKHSRYVQPERGGLDPKYDYAHAYIAPDKRYVTTMGYDVDAKKILPAYSAAGQSFSGDPLGISIDQPHAADCASLFRLTTQVMSAYGGDNVARWEPTTLDMVVEPTIGGTILPGSLGPYPKGSSVTLKAIPRAGHTFSHWQLDGKDAGKQPVISVQMNLAHKVTAYFQTGADYQHTLIADPSITASNGLLHLNPVSGSYPYGTEVKVEWAVRTVGLRDKGYSWVVNGQDTGASVNNPLFRIMEDDVKIGNQLNIVMENVVPDRNSWVVTCCVRDHWGPLPGQGLTVKAVPPPGESKVSILVHNPKVTTDTFGRFTVSLDPGHANEVVLEITTDDGSSLPLQLNSYVVDGFNTVNCLNADQFVFPGDSPAPLTIHVADSRGVGVYNAGILGKILHNSIELTLKNASARTDEKGNSSGETSIAFNALNSVNIKMGSAIVQIQASSAIPTLARVHVIPKQLGELFKTTNIIQLSPNEYPAPLIIELPHKVYDISEMGFKDTCLEAVIASDGGTGLGLVVDKIALAPDVRPGKDGAAVFFTPAKKIGTAMLRFYLSHAGKRIYDDALEITVLVRG